MTTFSRYNLVSLCLVGSALLLFLYTLNDMRTETGENQALRPWPLLQSSLPVFSSETSPSSLSPISTTNSSPVTSISASPPSPSSPPSSPSPLPSPSINSSPSLPHFDIAHVAAIFRRQAGQRKLLFERALNSSFPSIVDVLESIAPEVYCPSIARIGSVADGGKWVCNPWKMPKGGVVFSLGSHDDISFERDLQRETGRAATIITVDMTAASQSSLDGLSQIGATFVHAMIAETTNLDKSPPHYTVQDLMKKMGHGHIEILKMDIEGAELTVLPQFLKFNSVCQILLEIHNYAKTPKLLRTVANAGFLLQKYELNTHGLSLGVCEYSLIHESCLEKYGATFLASYLKQ